MRETLVYILNLLVRLDHIKCTWLAAWKRREAQSIFFQRAVLIFTFEKECESWLPEAQRSVVWATFLLLRIKTSEKQRSFQYFLPATIFEFVQNFLINIKKKFLAEGYLTSCTFDYLSQTVSNKLFVISIFSFAYLIPMSLIIYFYSRIVGLVVNHEKALKEQVRTIIINLCIFCVCVCVPWYVMWAAAAQSITN